MHPAGLSRTRARQAALDRTEAAAREILSLPMFPELDPGAITQMRF
jgi:hypothetical protein